MLAGILCLDHAACLVWVSLLHGGMLLFLSGVLPTSQCLRNPVIESYIFSTTDEEQDQQHDEIGGSEFDSVVQDRYRAAAGKPAVIAVLLEQFNRLGLARRRFHDALVREPTR